MPPISLNDAVNAITGNALPILFCDTCALLDLIRLPIRENSLTNVISTLSSAISILEATSAGNMYLVLPPLVNEEWEKHSQRLLCETETHFKKLETQITIAKEIATLGNQSLQSEDLQHLELHKLLYQLSENLLNASVILAQEDNIKVKATDRTLACTAPASKGKEIQDCLIYEHALWIMSELRNQSFLSPIVFLTSNTKDFCESNSVAKEPIKNELSSLSASLATKWNWAKKELTV